MGKNKIENAEELQRIIDAVGRHIPEGFLLSLHIEKGKVTVTLMDEDLEEVFFEVKDKTVVEQLNNALCVANGWSTSK